MKRDFLNLSDFGFEELSGLIDEASKLKGEHKQGEIDTSLLGKTLGMLFEKNSTRTRVSFEVAMLQLGGHAIYMDSQSSQLCRGETLEDTAAVLSRYLDAIVYRTHSHEQVVILAKYASIPVINGLSDESHPVQVLSDLLTLRENDIDLSDMNLCYLGDWNNMSRSWLSAADIFGFELWIACPKDVLPKDQKSLSQEANVHFTTDAKLAAKKADVIYTDAWISMGQQEVLDVKKYFPFQVNDELLQCCSKKPIVLHCLPAHCGEEITTEVMHGPYSRIFDQAENRLHLQKALLKKLI